MFKAASRIAAAATLVITSMGMASPAHAAAEPFPGTPEQIRDTGPCGPTGGYHPWEWAQTTTDPGLQEEVDTAAVREDWYWRHDDNTLWRGDTREDPQPIFDGGFTPLGTNLIPLNQFIVGGGGQGSAHVSTSCVRWVAQGFATGGTTHTGWVYAIQAPGGIDVNATARMTHLESPYLWNKEIDFPGGIKGKYIEGACKYHWLGNDPQTNASIYEELGCVTNKNFHPNTHVKAAPVG